MELKHKATVGKILWLDNLNSNRDFPERIKVVKELDKIYGKDNYEYSIWHKNGRHDVEVRYENQVFDYKYYDEETFRLEKEDVKTL